MIILFRLLRKSTKLQIEDKAILKLAELMAYTMFFNLFLTGAEVFKEVYSDKEHSGFPAYLYFGLGEHNKIVPFARLTIIFDVLAFFIFLIPATRKNFITFNIGRIYL